MYKLHFVCFLFLLTFLPAAAFAELSFCNGVWTNQACDQEEGEEEASTKSLEETKKAPPSKAEKNLSLKKSILHEVTMDRVEARRKYSVIVPASSAENICQDPESKVEACKEAAEKYSSRLQSRVDSALKAKELEKQKEEPKEEQNDNTTVVVVNPKKKSSRGNTNIIGHRTSSESGVSVNVSGNSRNGNLSGSIKLDNVISNDYLKNSRAENISKNSKVLTNDFQKEVSSPNSGQRPKPKAATAGTLGNLMRKPLSSKSKIISAPGNTPSASQ